MPVGPVVRYSGSQFQAPLEIYDTTGALILGVTAAGAVTLGKTGGSLGLLGAAAAAQGAAYTQTFATAGRTHTALTSAVMPAGGTGAAAGGWDTAANRDQAIAEFAALRTDVTQLKNLINAIIDDLQAAGISA